MTVQFSRVEYNFVLQGGEDSWDALSCKSFFVKELLIIGLFCEKRPVRTRHPMTLRHHVHRFLSFQTSPSRFYCLTAPVQKLLNVYVPHSLDKEWIEEFVLRTTVSNDDRKQPSLSENFDRKTKIKFHSGTGSTKKPGSHQESKSNVLTEKFEWIRKKNTFLARNLNTGCSSITTPAKHVL